MYESRLLYYITHKDNVQSILKHGILCHNQIQSSNIRFTPIYDESIVRRRSQKLIDNIALGNYVNLFVNARNAMLYRVVNERSVKDVVVLALRTTLLDKEGTKVTDGLAADSLTRFFPASNFGAILRENSGVLESDFWNDTDGSKRRMMTEVLIPGQLEPEFLEAIYVGTPELREELSDIATQNGKKIIFDPHMFFKNELVCQIDKIRICRGDMFFSRAQTHTVSVNTQGVMGKGLASRVKYQFPDVYVRYQDACRSKKVRLGLPYLYKREYPYRIELADEGDQSEAERLRTATWFLLFATKGDWKKPAVWSGIVQGLDWLVENSRALSITSLALPALGCGLGKLPWAEVGPLIVQKLLVLDMHVEIYLPNENGVTVETSSAEYLRTHIPREPGKLPL